MSAPLPASHDGREQARQRAQASLERKDARASATSRFGSPQEQQADYEAACRQFNLTPGQTA